VSGNPSQYDDLDVFIQEQRAFESVAEKSLLPTLSLDITSKTIDAVVDEIADYLYATRRIYPDY
jgi:hypothetical protein